MVSNDDATQRAGRRWAHEIVTRRLEALSYLKEEWPPAAELLDAVYHGRIPAGEISEKIKAVVADAKVKRDHQFETILDAATVNPEQAMVKALETLGEIAVQRENCNLLHRDLTTALAMIDEARQELNG